jgi:hypothetical protein
MLERHGRARCLIDAARTREQLLLQNSHLLTKR